MPSFIALAWQKIVFLTHEKETMLDPSNRLIRVGISVGYYLCIASNKLHGINHTTNIKTNTCNLWTPNIKHIDRNQM